MKITTFRLAIASLLGLALALNAASPASARNYHGALKADRRAVHRDHNAFKDADTRAERRADHANLFYARQNLDQQRFQLNQTRLSHRELKRERKLGLLNSAPLGTPTDVYHAHYN